VAVCDRHSASAPLRFAATTHTDKRLCPEYEHPHDGLKLEIRNQEVGMWRMRRDAEAFGTGGWEWRAKFYGFPSTDHEEPPGYRMPPIGVQPSANHLHDSLRRWVGY
jgi:hypothetical protein